MAWDAAPALQEDDFRRFRITYGYTDALALTANYNFSLDEMRHATFAGSQTTESMKTAFHETTHVYQMLATSYGYYIQLLLDFQVNQIILIVNLLREQFGMAPRLPLSRQVLGLPQSRSAEIRLALQSWYVAEILRVYFEGSPDRYTDHLETHAELFERPTLATFALMNYWLTGYVIETGRGVLPHPARNIRLPWTEDELVEREQVDLAFKLFGDVDVAAVLESAGRAAEYWGQEGPVPEGLVEADRGTPIDLIEYSHFIRLAADRLPTDDVRTFTLTFGVLADLALNPPILPHHADLRGDRTGLSDLSPVARMRTAIEHVGGIRPVSSLADDYQRFVSELCQVCRWPTPGAVGDRFREAAPSEPPDRGTELYLRSLALRSEVPSIFNDLSVWYPPDTPLSSTVRYYFSHPIMQFTDAVRMHNDQALMRFFIERFMLRDYLRRILLSQDPTVTLPYAADPEEVASWADILAEILASIGFVRPRVVVRTGPIALPHTA